MQLSRLSSDCLTHLAALGRSRHTILNYDIAYRQLLAYITVTLGLTDDARHFTDSAVIGFMNELHKKGADQNTIRARLSALASLAKYGARVKDGRGRPVIGINPMAGLERPQRKRPPEKFLLPDELWAFLSVPRPLRDAVVRDVLLDTGLRRAELCAANVGDLIRIEGQTTLQVTVKGGMTTQLPISPPIAGLLQDWLLSRNLPGPTEPLLINTKGERYTGVTLAGLILRIGKAAGIARFDVTPHVIRHTLEIIRRRQKIDPAVRSRLLTHTSFASLGWYQHVLPDELVAARQQQWEGLQTYLGPGRDDASQLCYQAGQGKAKSQES
jgi:integrase